MKKVIFSIGTILFLTLTVLAVDKKQGASLKGIIVDSESDEPLFGVAVIYRDAPVAFSDDRGYFILPIDNVQPQDVILFRHLSYHDKSVSFNRLCSDTVVRMENRFFSLSEVPITPINYQKLIKKNIWENITT